MLSGMNKRGLSLLEILVATIIFALVITGLASVFLTGKRHLLRSRSKINVAEVIKSFLEPLQMQVRQDQWFSTSNCLGTGNCPGWTLPGESNITYSLVNTWTIISGTLRKVKTTVNWSLRD